MMTLRRHALCLSALLVFTPALLTTSGCHTLLAPRKVEITREQLLARLAQHFPMRNQVLDLFEVTAEAPKLILQPDHDRVLADIDLAARDKLFGRQYRGSLWLSFGLRHEPRDQTIRLDRVRIDKVAFKGLPEGYERHLTKLGSWLTEDRLQDHVVHRFTPDQLHMADQHGLSVTDIKVTERGLAVMLSPKP